MHFTKIVIEAYLGESAPNQRETSAKLAVLGVFWWVLADFLGLAAKAANKQRASGFVIYVKYGGGGFAGNHSFHAKIINDIHPRA